MIARVLRSDTRSPAKSGWVGWAESILLMGLHVARTPGRGKRR
jgi:hypothetical protein